AAELGFDGLDDRAHRGPPLAPPRLRRAGAGRRGNPGQNRRMYESPDVAIELPGWELVWCELEATGDPAAAPRLEEFRRRQAAALRSRWTPAELGEDPV